jgi:hypothetical protein
VWENQIQAHRFGKLFLPGIVPHGVNPIWDELSVRPDIPVEATLDPRAGARSRRREIIAGS